MKLIRVSALAGAALHYDRFTPDQYGGEGAPFEPWIEENFAGQLENCFREMAQKLSPTLGRLQIIVSGGVAREGDGASLHHQHRAFDLDGLVFERTHLRSKDFPSAPHLYLAVEAILRRHFGVVLAYDFNKAHEDHFHIDNSRQTGLRRDARSHSVFVQNLLTYVYDLPVLRDGLWGGETEAAAKRLCSRYNFSTLSDTKTWLTFCDLAAAHALTCAASDNHRLLNKARA